MRDEAGWLGLAAVAWLAGTPAAWAQEEPVWRVHDVRALEDACVPDPDFVDLRPPLWAYHLDALDPGEPAVPLEEPFSIASGWTELLAECLGSESPNVEARPGELWLRAAPETQRRLERLLADLEAHLLRTVELDVYLLAAEAVEAGLGPLLTRAQTERWIASATPLEHASKTAGLGRRERILGRSREALVYEYDVENVFHTVVGDPQVTVLHHGTELGVVVHDAGEDGYFLRAWGRRAERSAPTRRLAVDDMSAAPIQLPHAASTLVAGSGTIPDGGALLLGHDRGAHGLWLVRVRSVDSGPAPLSCVPIGRLIAPPMLPTPGVVIGPEPAGGWEWASLLDGMAEDRWNSVSRTDWLEATLLEESAGLQLEGSLHLLGGAVYVHGSSALFEWTRAAVERLRADRARTVGVELRYGLVAPETAERVARGELAPDELAGALDGRVCGAARAGDALLVVGGDQSAYLKDYDIEISGAAYGPDPIVDTFFEGFTFWCRPVPVRNGRVSLWVDFVVQERLRELLELPAGIALWGYETAGDAESPGDRPPSQAPLELPELTHSVARAQLCVQDGRWARLAVTPLAGTDRVLVALVRASVLTER